MIKILIASISFTVVTSVLASGCDSNYFYFGTMNGQAIEKDYGILSQQEATKVIAQMTSVHRSALKTWSVPPVVNSNSKIKRVTTSYIGLDTDCGWRHFGATLFITHLEITNDNGSILYPDIYGDIYPEYEYYGADEYIRIEK